MYYSALLQCAAVCCVLQCSVSVLCSTVHCYSVLQCAVYYSALCYSVLQCAVYCSVLCYSVLQCAVYCSVL